MLLHFDCFEKDVLVIGSDRTAMKIIASLVDSGAVVTLIAKKETLCNDLLSQVGSGEFAWFNRAVLPRDVEGKSLVFNFDDVATIQAACKARSITSISSKSEFKTLQDNENQGKDSVFALHDQLSINLSALSLSLRKSSVSSAQRKYIIQYITRHWTLEDIMLLNSKEIMAIIDIAEKGDIHSNGILARKNYNKANSIHRSLSQTTINGNSDKSDYSPKLHSPPSPIGWDEDLNFQTWNETISPKMIDLNSFNSSVSAAEAVANVAYTFSDMIFLYPAHAKSEIENGIELARSEKKANIRGIVPKVVNMVSTSTSGSTIIGAMQSGQSGVSVMLSSAALGYLLPSMYGFARNKLAPVFHVAAFKFDDDMALHHSYSDVLKAAYSGFVLIASSSLEEAQDMSILSHLLARASSSPVLHFFDGSLISSQRSPLKSYDNDHVLSALKETRDIQGDILPAFQKISCRLAHLFGKVYLPFEYHGSSNARIVFVSLGVASKFLLESCGDLNGEGLPVGFLNIRIYRPWSKENLLAVLPKNVKRIVIVDESKSSLSSLLAEFETSLYASEFEPILSLASFKEGQENLNPFAVKKFMRSYLIGENHLQIDLSGLNFEEFLQKRDFVESIFWDSLPTRSSIITAKVFLDHQKFTGSHLQQLYVQHLSTAVEPGIVSHIRLSQKLPIQNIHLIHDANLVMCNSVETSHNFAASISKFGNLFINTSLSTAELLNIWPTCVKNSLFEKRVKIYALDVETIARNFTIFYGNSKEYQSEILASIFYFLAFSKEGFSKLIDTQKERLKEESLNENIFHSQNEAILYALDHLDFFCVTEFIEEQVKSDLLPIFPKGTLPSDMKISARESTSDPSFRLIKKHEAALPILFPSAFKLSKIFRPDLKDVFTVKVAENIRLTPETYDRNVFHMELDISGKNVNYDIGTALGVFSQNNEEKVASFLVNHNFDGKQLITIDRCDEFGVHSSEVKTLEQLLIKSLDIFGKPGKKFFQFLARHAKNDEDKEKIASILSTSESLDEFLEYNTPTFADLLKFFPSIHLTVEELIKALPPIKPRLYSISSSQRVHPNSIHLLVVLVDWTCKADGSHRYGQTTNYLVNSKIGDEITVCLKPSVMKLPPNLEDPVIMAGLGTGMAPFRAFIEERMYWKRKGCKVGPMALYFGSRNRANEYLYGEELEAYNADGLLTYLRLAFSRDQPQKIYIQNRIQQDSEILHDLIVKKKGSFYLCGPTWPVPDVTDALLSSFGISMSLEESGHYLNELKEQERFVLEVY